MTIRTREEARRRNARHYHTGLPCVHGHYSKRFTSNGACTVCVAEKSIDFYISKHQDRYFEKSLQYMQSIRPAKFVGEEFAEEFEAVVERMKYLQQLRTMQKFKDDKVTAHVKIKKPETPPERSGLVPSHRTEFRKP